MHNRYCELNLPVKLRTTHRSWPDICQNTWFSYLSTADYNDYGDLMSFSLPLESKNYHRFILLCVLSITLLDEKLIYNQSAWVSMCSCFSCCSLGHIYCEWYHTVEREFFYAISRHVRNTIWKYWMLINNDPVCGKLSSKDV